MAGEAGKRVAGGASSQSDGRNLGKCVVRVADGAVNAVVVVVLVGLFAIGCYALWDSQTVVDQARATRWQPYKPTEPEPLSFWELQRINPEVRAWIDVYGTGIDYPVCQSSDAWKYLTTDAKGEYSLTGALFMDPAASPDFSDFASFVYGHHMDHDVMFGQVTDFLDEQFFDEHPYGNLFANDRNWGLEFFACLQADAYDTSVYRTSFADAADRETWLNDLMSRAASTRDIGVGPGDRVVVLSTCSTDQTNGRTLLMARMAGDTFENTFVTWPNTGTGVDGVAGVLGVSWYALASGAAVVLIVAALALLGRRSGKASRDARAASGENTRSEAEMAKEDSG